MFFLRFNLTFSWSFWILFMIDHGEHTGASHTTMGLCFSISFQAFSRPAPVRRSKPVLRSIGCPTLRSCPATASDRLWQPAKISMKSTVPDSVMHQSAGMGPSQDWHRLELEELDDTGASGLSNFLDASGSPSGTVITGFSCWTTGKV